jgi:hypothetical protein
MIVEGSTPCARSRFVLRICFAGLLSCLAPVEGFDSIICIACLISRPEDRLDVLSMCYCDTFVKLPSANDDRVSEMVK